VKVGDLVQWVGGDWGDLHGIITDTRKSYPLDDGGIKVIWYKGLLGNYKQPTSGAWQKEKKLKVLSSLERDNENR